MLANILIIKLAPRPLELTCNTTFDVLVEEGWRSSHSRWIAPLIFSNWRGCTFPEKTLIEDSVTVSN